MTALDDIKDRIVGFERLHSSEILDHPANPNIHPQEQRDVMGGLLREIGKADALLVYQSEREGGKWVAINGHMRKNDFPGEWGCLVTDLNDDEADVLIQSFDAVGRMALADAETLRMLREKEEAEDQAIRDLLDSIAPIQEEKTTFQKVVVPPPPEMSWVLIGIPTAKYDDIADFVETASLIPESIVEVSVSDGEKEENGQSKPQGEA